MKTAPKQPKPEPPSRNRFFLRGELIFDAETGFRNEEAMAEVTRRMIEAGAYILVPKDKAA